LNSTVAWAIPARKETVLTTKSLLDALTNFDANAVIVKALAASGPKLVKLATDQARKTPERIAASLGLGYSDHLQTTFDRCYKIKTLIYRDEPVQLLSQYVSINLGLKNKKISDKTIIGRIEDFRNVIVQGSGGSGKTMFMKYLALCRFENPNGRIPIFVEMRSLDYASEKSLVELIYNYSTAKKSKITLEQFDQSMSRGLFLVILDGLDEVDPDFRIGVHRQILDLPVKYPDNLLVASSREDPSLGGWGPFYVFNVLPLDKRQVTSVIKKIDFDAAIKTKFLKELAADLYVKHKSFLTNPLLATIMLLRYDQFANSSNKIYIFYEQAFETLFFKHDLSKGVYERKRYTKLTVDEFGRFFAAFSFSSYAKNRFIFSRADLSDRIVKALRHSQLESQPSSVIRDLVESVCIMQEDGLNYSFVHRSFQEYFAALFVANYHGPKLEEYVYAIMNRGQTEAAGVLLHEMAPDLVERNWTMPLLLKSIATLDSDDIAGNYAKILCIICGDILLDRDGGVRGFGIGTVGNDLLTLSRFYRSLMVPWLTTSLLFSNRNEVDAVLSHFNADRRKDVAKRISNLSDDRLLKCEDTDNEWLALTRLPGIVDELMVNLKAASKELEKKLASQDVADDDLL